VGRHCGREIGRIFNEVSVLLDRAVGGHVFCVLLGLFGDLGRLIEIGALMKRNERVLLVAPSKATAARAARRVVAAEGEVIVITSVAEARALVGEFDRGIFAFDLPDGSGIVLAAEMMLDARMGEIEFLHPADELVVRDGHPAETRSTSSAIDPKQMAWNAA
jgi:hypothetical protein